MATGYAWLFGERIGKRACQPIKGLLGPPSQSAILARYGSGLNIWVYREQVLYILFHSSDRDSTVFLAMDMARISNGASYYFPTRRLH